MCALSCLTLYDPMDASSPGSSVHGFLQARTLEWVAISFSRGSLQLNPCLLHLLDCKKILYLLSHWGFPVPGRYTSTLVIYSKVSSIELTKGVAREKHRRKIQPKIKPYRITIKVMRVRDWKLRPLWIHCFSPSVANCFPGMSTLCFEGLSVFPLTLERNLSLQVNRHCGRHLSWGVGQSVQSSLPQLYWNSSELRGHDIGNKRCLLQI